jgi:hypothetical protein
MVETDKAVSQILEAIQTITPEVAEQAVAYYRFTDMVWFVIWAMIAVVAAKIGGRCLTVVLRDGWYVYDTITGSGVATIVSACVSGIAWLVCVGLACDLVATYIAPDYYAADCMVDLVRKVLH